MQTFWCACGTRVFFENTRCLTCWRELGFLPDVSTVSALEPTRTGTFSTGHGDYRKCSNYVDEGVCNWMVPVSAAGHLCDACQLNHVIPNLSQPENRILWRETEKAKRRLIYGLHRLRLPLVSKQEDPKRGLAFDIKSDVGSTRVVTGHQDGLITMNLAEADAPERERVRVAMKESYRTLLGHFRHEIGHYYWDRLVRDSPNLGRFRELFGDERASYAEAINFHYSKSNSAQSDYAELFISTYAGAHPWEDFAETFAHYLHMQDTLETAHSFGFTMGSSARPDTGDIREFARLLDEWTDLTIALNALNRSMGLPDAYPFAISGRVKEKIEFIHTLIGRA
ncbi:MAG: putative zinc-binding peptidase [Myxococcota bacterium]|nr:putative zinc-binding peptidase [Myxococcota bacterium]